MKSKINSSTLKSRIRDKEKFRSTQGNKREAQYRKETMAKRKRSNITLNTLMVETKSYISSGAYQLQYLINHWFSHWKSQEV